MSLNKLRNKSIIFLNKFDGLIKKPWLIKKKLINFLFGKKKDLDL